MFEKVCGSELRVVEVRDAELPIADAIGTYLFNSQIVTLPNNSLALIAPVECREHAGARRVIDQILAGDSPVSVVHFVDVRQSMRNGGGPACLRLRILLSVQEIAALHAGVLFDEPLYQALQNWIQSHYRDELASNELSDPKLLEESRVALDELTKILNLPAIYSFQQ
jgi:succinylarginine dihydrolase